MPARPRWLHLVDVQGHDLPGVDDSPAPLADAAAVCFAATTDAVRTVIAASHLRRRPQPNRDAVAPVMLRYAVQSEVEERPRIEVGAGTRIDSHARPAELDAMPPGDPLPRKPGWPGAPALPMLLRRSQSP